MTSEARLKWTQDSLWGQRRYLDLEGEALAFVEVLASEGNDVASTVVDPLA